MLVPSKHGSNNLKIGEDSPAPMAPLTETRLSRQNIELLQHMVTATPLTLPEVWRMKWELFGLTQRLGRADVEPALDEYKRLLPIARKHKRALAMAELNPRAAVFAEKTCDDYERFHRLQNFLKQHRDDINRQRYLTIALQSHELAIDERRQKALLEKQQRKESRIYQKLLIDLLTRLGINHTYTVYKGGRPVQMTDRIKFSDVFITPDTIFYQIATSYKTAFGSWKTDIPYGVHIRDIINDDTALHLSRATNRNVTVKHNQNGVYLLLHRDTSTDGLLNYVALDDVLAKYPKERYHEYTFCVGVAEGRVTKWRSFQRDPHWQIAGQTGGGKSNFVNAIILQMIMLYPPRELRLMLVDLKGGVEFFDYKELPHLARPIAETLDDTLETLREAAAIMNERYAKLKADGVRNFEEYKDRHGSDEFPRLVVIIDEAADMKDNSDRSRETIDLLIQIARKGRAAGVNLILCTQYPKSDVLPTHVTAQFSGRVVFRMQTLASSISVIGSAAASNIPNVKGRAVALEGADEIAIQTPHVTPEAQENILQIAMNAEPGAKMLVSDVAKASAREGWTVEAVAKFAIEHMQPQGMLSATRMFETIKKLNMDDITFRALDKLVKHIIAEGGITIDGAYYEVEHGARHLKVLKLSSLQDDKFTSLQEAS